ncbi:hypothetical protein ACLB2K_031347 [Fragaria x ananassa]
MKEANDSSSRSISDNGGGPVFPNLTNMKIMRRLMLRSCNLSGPIPDLKAMPVLNILDLSFNRLEGSFTDVDTMVLDPDNLQYLYLTSNLLTGSIPQWIKDKDNRYQIDVSYNNFSKDFEPPKCSEYLNVFRSSSAQNNSG